MIAIGFTLNGKTKEFANQYLITEFFSFGVPIFPICSYFINDESGLKIKIPLSKDSLRTFYFGGTLIFVGCVLFGSSWMLASALMAILRVPHIELVPFIVSVIILLAGIYNYFIKTKSDKNEIKKRTVLQMATGINALPEWLGVNEANKVFESLQVNFHADWRKLIKDKNYDKKDFYRLFSLIAYEVYIKNTFENKKLMNEMEKVFNK